MQSMLALAAQHGWRQVDIPIIDLSDIGDPLDTELLDGFEKSGVTVFFGRTEGHFGLVTFDKSRGDAAEWDWRTLGPRGRGDNRPQIDPHGCEDRGRGVRVRQYATEGGHGAVRCLVGDGWDDGFVFGSCFDRVKNKVESKD